MEVMKAKEAVAVGTDTSVATDKNTTTTTASSTTSMKPVRSDDEKSVELDDDRPEVPDFTPPLRINATRVPERLMGSTSNLHIPGNLREKVTRRKSEPMSMSSRSESRSPGGGNYDGGSSISSLEEAIDSDILTDKMGFLELEANHKDLARGLNTSISNLPAVAERMSDENLEDCHAFSDVRWEGNISRGNSITTGGEVSSNMLEPLDECDDEDSNEGGQVILTNMEEILEDEIEEDTNGEGETPSLPTS